MKKPVILTHEPPTVEETARRLGVSKKRTGGIEAARC